MWIRSQNKTVLIKTNLWVHRTRATIYADEEDILGKYATDERCFEILDEIQMAIINDKKVFQMPEE